MRNVSDKSCRENHNPHFVFNNFFFRKSYRLWDMWKNIVERGRAHMTIWRMRIACWIPKATNTHTGCVLLAAFPLQRRLHERASMLLYCLSCFLVVMAVVSLSFIFPISFKTIRSRRCIISRQLYFWCLYDKLNSRGWKFAVVLWILCYLFFYFYRCTVHFEDSVIITYQQMH
jgi:hypothetical protein